MTLDELHTAYSKALSNAYPETDRADLVAPTDADIQEEEEAVEGIKEEDVDEKTELDDLEPSADSTGQHALLTGSTVSAAEASSTSTEALLVQARKTIDNFKAQVEAKAQAKRAALEAKIVQLQAEIAAIPGETAAEIAAFEQQHMENYRDDIFEPSESHPASPGLESTLSLSASQNQAVDTLVNLGYTLAQAHIALRSTDYDLEAARNSLVAEQAHDMAALNEDDDFEDSKSIAAQSSDYGPEIDPMDFQFDDGTSDGAMALIDQGVPEVIAAAVWEVTKPNVARCQQLYAFMNAQEMSFDAVSVHRALHFMAITSDS